MATSSTNVNICCIASHDQEFNLEKCFTLTIENKPLTLTPKNLQNILCNDLQLVPSAVPENLYNAAAESLIYFMKAWPGWSQINDYNAGNITFQQWYRKFRKFLIFKINYIISNKNKFIEEVIKEEPESVKDIKIQTASMISKPNAPYKLIITGPPHLLNNIVFAAVNGDMHIKQHVEKPWEELSLKELLNWPYVSVEIRLPDIHFIRTTYPDYTRYASYDSGFTCSDASDEPKVRELSSQNQTHNIYANSYFSVYFQQFIETVKSIGHINPQKLTELRNVFEEFMKDLNEMNLENSTMATNVSVEYNIGNFTYLRNKKMVHNESSSGKLTQPINFYEILKPMTSLELFRFTPSQDLSTTNVTFVSLNNLMKCGPKFQSNFKSRINNYCISYKCAFCITKFTGFSASKLLKEHFKTHHKAEQAVVCMKCRKQFDFNNLVIQRWSHACVEKNTTTAESEGVKN